MTRGEKNLVTEGLVCVLKALESCQTFGIYRNRKTRKLDLEARKRQGLALYHYWIEPTGPSSKASGPPT